MKWLPTQSEKASRQRVSTSSSSAQNSPNSAAHVVHPPVVDPPQARGDRPVAARPVADRELGPQRLAAGDREQPPQLLAGVAAPRPRPARSRRRRPPAPSCRASLEQRAAVVELPVEAALRDAERLRRAARSAPRRARRRRGRARPSSIQRSGGVRVIAIASIRYRMDMSIGEIAEQRPHLAALADPRADPGLPTSRTSGRCRRPASGTTSTALVRGRPRSSPGEGNSRAVRALFALRWKLGEWFGWDDEDDGLGSRVPTLRDRLPSDLRSSAPALHSCAPLQAALPARRRVRGRDRQPDRARRHARRLGPEPRRRLPWPDGGAGQAERNLRGRLHEAPSPRSGT